MNKAQAFARVEKEKKRQFALGRFAGLKRAGEMTMDEAVKCFINNHDDEAGILRDMADKIVEEKDKIDLLP